MIEIELLNGEIYIDQQPIDDSPKQLISTNKSGDKYFSATKSDLEINNYIFKITKHYKNSHITSLTILLDPKWIKDNYNSNNSDYKDYITQYISFCKEHINILLDSLLNTKKRKFAWGKIQILTDPRDSMVFAEVKYYKKM